jgi:polysaccharide pyruvyl transferase WcaK-like protein
MKITITGPLADKNLGDYGMFVNNLYTLGQEHDFTVFSYNSSFVNELQKDFLAEYKLDFVDVKLESKKEKTRSLIDKLKYFRQLLKGNIHKSYPTPLEITNRCKNLDVIKKTIQETDVLIVSGGGYFNDLWYEWSRKDDLFKIIVPIIVASQLKKKIIFTANGFGPFDRSKAFYSMIFKEAERAGAIFSCRDDKLSPLYLSDLGIFNFNELPLYIQDSKLSKSMSHEKYGKYSVLELYGNRTDLEENIDLLREHVIRQYEKGIKTVFMPFDIDENTKSYLRKNIDSEGFVFFEQKSYLKLDEAIAMLANAEFVICNRYHALVLAVSNKTPVFNVIKSVGDLRYYYNKNAGFLDRTFNSENVDYSSFIKESLKDVLLSLKNDTALNEQKKLYEHPVHALNKANLTQARESFFSRSIKGSSNDE